jgi:hypothetical protein
LTAHRTAKTYLERKEDILTRCLRLTEDIYSGIASAPESLPELFDRRMAVLRELGRLDEDAAEAKAACPAEALERSDAKLRLIQSLDEKIETTLRDAQHKLHDSMKSNMMEQKFTGYAAPADAGRGRLLDEKK